MSILICRVPPFWRIFRVLYPTPTTHVTKTWGPQSAFFRLNAQRAQRRINQLLPSIVDDDGPRSRVTQEEEEDSKGCYYRGKATKETTFVGASGLSQ